SSDLLNRISQPDEDVHIQPALLPETDDIKVARKNALDYYRANFQGTSVVRDEIGEVHFYKSSINETNSHASVKTLRFIPYIKDIILTGEIQPDEKPKHSKNIDHFIPITKEYVIEDEIIKAIVKIAVDRNGNKYYVLQTKTDSILSSEQSERTARQDSATPVSDVDTISVSESNVNFKRWFGDSKVVDENGKPLVVYHGGAEFSPDGIGVFQPGSVTGASRGSYLKEGYFFSNKKEVSENYGTVNTAYLSMQNPYVVNVRHELSQLDYDIETEREEAEEAGYPITNWLGRKPEDIPYGPSDFIALDSATAYFDDNAQEIYKNAVDSGSDGIIVEGADGSATYIVFSSDQIKSATDNNGNYDPNDPNIFHQDERSGDVRGYFDWTNASSQMVAIMKSGDRDTVVHELAHFFSVNYIKLAIETDQPDKIAALARYYNVSDPMELIASNRIQEDLAVKFMTYVKTDESQRGFRRYFDALKYWMIQMWEKLKSAGYVSDGELAPEIEEFFDAITNAKPANVDLAAIRRHKAGRRVRGQNRIPTNRGIKTPAGWTAGRIVYYRSRASMQMF
ncbi:MAG: hypothetical protein LBB08_02910, partial [Rickettsiales bacterium]|nr:hypothetical protein [Rickettsiales bacterium]